MFFSLSQQVNARLKAILLDFEDRVFEAVIDDPNVLGQVLGVDPIVTFNNDPGAFINTMRVLTAEGYINLVYDTMRIIAFTEQDPAGAEAVDPQDQLPPLPLDQQAPLPQDQQALLPQDQEAPLPQDQQPPLPLDQEDDMHD